MSKERETRLAGRDAGTGQFSRSRMPGRTGGVGGGAGCPSRVRVGSRSALGRARRGPGRTKTPEKKKGGSMYLKQRIAAIDSDGERHVLKRLGPPHQPRRRSRSAPAWTACPRFARRTAGCESTREGRYQVVQTGEILASSDPDAL